jgi:hypothetical protein
VSAGGVGSFGFNGTFVESLYLFQFLIQPFVKLLPPGHLFAVLSASEPGVDWEAPRKGVPHSVF